MGGGRTAHARTLFDGIAPRYDAPAEILSFGQYGRWRRALVASLGLRPSDRVCDVATGTAGIARAIERRYGCTVIGVDQSEGMLARARGRVAGRRIALAGGGATSLPFPDGAFDALVFSYLLRYVDDPASTLRELARVVRPGGLVASVEFGLPPALLPRLGWRAYAQGAFPAATRLGGAGWAAVGAFLPGSITAWATAWPPERQARAWVDAGITDVRIRPMTLGTAVIMRGRRRG